MSVPDVVAAVEPVVAAFERLGVTYRIGGSVASSALGVPRSTLDVDLVCNLAGVHVDRFVETLAGAYYIDAGMIEDAITRKVCFNLIHLATMIKVDVFILKARPWDVEAFSRSIRRSLDIADGARDFDITTPEDIILHKLEWYRLGGEISERQLRDVIGVIAVQAGSLDWDYLETWAGTLGLSDLLERARVQADGS